MDIISRKKAIEINLSHYYTGIPCKNGHIEKRNTIYRGCLGCSRMQMQKRFKERPESKEYYKVWRNRNPEANSEIVKRANQKKSRDRYHIQHYAKNSGRLKNTAEKWRECNKEKISSIQKNSKKKHYDRVLASNSKRRSDRINATPAWSDKKRIQEIYSRAIHLSRISGVKCHVNHIIPLKNNNVCGLHVHENLQILTAKENCQKRNSFNEVKLWR